MMAYCRSVFFGELVTINLAYLFLSFIKAEKLVSKFPDVIRMSVSTVSFLAQLDSGILCLMNTFF